MISIISSHFLKCMYLNSITFFWTSCDIEFTSSTMLLCNSLYSSTCFSNCCVRPATFIATSSTIFFRCPPCTLTGFNAWFTLNASSRVSSIFSSLISIIFSANLKLDRYSLTSNCLFVILPHKMWDSYLLITIGTCQLPSRLLFIWWVNSIAKGRPPV